MESLLIFILCLLFAIFVFLIVLVKVVVGLKIEFSEFMDNSPKKVE